MSNAALNAYLAKNYLDGAKADAMLARSAEGTGEKKRRKKKRPEAMSESSGSGLRVVDTGDERWKEEQGSDEEAVVVVADEEEHARRRQKWNKVGAAAAARADDGEGAPEDEKPQMAGEDGLGLDSSTQSEVARQLEEQRDATARQPAIRAGLKTREEMRAERLERERLAALQPADTTASQQEDQVAVQRKREREERAQETVYRDASGRRIDVRKDDEERRRAKDEERRREREKQDWNKGQVQLEHAREARKREEEEKHTSFAR